MREEWRAVVGYEGFYEVSSRGRVRSLDRWGTLLCRGKLACRVYSGRVLATSKHVGGYVLVTLQVGERRRTYGVHQLVAAAFLGPCPAGLEVCHWNGNPARNVPSNLRYGTRAENSKDRDRHGTTRRGEQHGCAKLTAADVRAIRAAAGKVRLKDLGKRYGTHLSNISLIQARRTWRHV